MDPEATLQCAQDAIEDCEMCIALEYLGYYRSWRFRGGYEPADGDKRAALMLAEAEEA